MSELSRAQALRYNSYYQLSDLENHCHAVNLGSEFRLIEIGLGSTETKISSSVSKNGEVYVPETSCMKGSSLHFNNM